MCSLQLDSEEFPVKIVLAGSSQQKDLHDYWWLGYMLCGYDMYMLVLSFLVKLKVGNGITKSTLLPLLN